MQRGSVGAQSNATAPAERTLDGVAASSRYNHVRWLGLIGGPLLAAVAYFLLPREFIELDGALVPLPDGARATLAVMTLMATWWLTEAVDVSATALLPLALFPILNISDIGTTAAPYASPLIFLFMGGFMLALAMQRWGLDRRIALATLRRVGAQPTHLVAGFMIATAGLSAFVSNTATTAMMLPMALSITALLKTTASGETESEAEHQFAVCLMLGIAYAASIGGMTTIIGTPPNLFLVGFINSGIAEPFRQEIGFVQWMGIGVPLALVLLPATWWLLTHVLFPVRDIHFDGADTVIDDHYRRLGAPTTGESVTVVVFGITAAAWIFRPVLNSFEIDTGQNVLTPFAALSDAGIAITGALALFVIPVNRRERVFALDWETAKQLPWGVLVLFGGGLSLATAVENNGVAEFIGAQATVFADWPDMLLVLAVVSVVVFLTELTSNTATAAALIPVLAALAPGLGLHPYSLIVPAALAASCAFMMPVATPPNAIVYASGHVTIAQMCRAGVSLNVAGIILITLLTYSVIAVVLGIPS